MSQLNASIADIPIPRYMRSLPISPRGYPVPWFVAKVKGEYDFRVVDPPKITRAVRQKLCWLCGNTLGRRLAFVIGPMCAVNRVSSEPPSHLECAQYSVAACPFLTKPKMRRNEKDLPQDGMPAAGISIDRNPGVALIWVCTHYKPFRPEVNSHAYLFQIGKPDRIAFYREGRAATREEIMESIDSGMPFLRRMAEQEGPRSIDELEFKYREAVRLLPAA